MGFPDVQLPATFGKGAALLLASKQNPHRRHGKHTSFDNIALWYSVRLQPPLRTIRYMLDWAKSHPKALIMRVLLSLLVIGLLIWVVWYGFILPD
jgi:hypothetical protein